MTDRRKEHALSAWRRALDLDLAGDSVFLRMLGLLAAELLMAAGVLAVAGGWSLSDWSTALSSVSPLPPKSALLLILPALLLALIAVNATDRATAAKAEDPHLRGSLIRVAVVAVVLSLTAALLALAVPMWLTA